jgi:hypothetical protein
MEYGEVQSAAEENSDDVAESAAESYDDVTESAEESYDAETNKAAGAYDSNAFEPESENADSAALDITSAGEHTEDGTPADFEVEVSGSITRSGDEYILTVTAVLSTTESDYNISENDKFKLIAAGDKTNLKDGETVSYENIRLDNLKPITENDAANTGHEISYTAEVVMVE